MEIFLFFVTFNKETFDLLFDGVKGMLVLLVQIGPYLLQDALSHVGRFILFNVVVCNNNNDNENR